MSCGSDKPSTCGKCEGDTQQNCLEKKAAANACEGDSSGGFFSWLFGGSSSSEDTSREKCPGGCGMDKCNCNCALRDHLKQCCDYGKLPALVTKDCCPVPKEDKCVEKKKEECVFRPVDTTCKPKTDERPPAFACDTKKEEKKCCMPCTDTSGCIPSWVCPPVSSGVRQYPAPAGACILPISATGRNSKKSAKCGECGTVSNDEKAKPKVSNPNCPMIRSRDCNPDKDKKDEGFLCSLVRKAAEIKELCNEIKAAAEEDNDGDFDCSAYKVQPGLQCSQNFVQEPQQCCEGFQNPGKPQDFKIPTEIIKKPTEISPDKPKETQSEPVYSYEIRPLSFYDEQDPCKFSELPTNLCPSELPAKQSDPCSSAQQIGPCSPIQQIAAIAPVSAEVSQNCPEAVKKVETVVIDETPEQGAKTENCCCYEYPAHWTKDCEPENSVPPPETNATCPARSRVRKCKPVKTTKNACPPPEVNPEDSCRPISLEPSKTAKNTASPLDEKSNDGDCGSTPDKPEPVQPTENVPSQETAEDCCCCDVTSELKPPAMLKENPPKECCILLKVSVVQESRKAIEEKCSQNGGRCMKKEPCVCDPAFLLEEEGVPPKKGEAETENTIGDCDPTIDAPGEEEKQKDTSIDISPSQSVVKVVIQSICCEDGLQPATIVAGKPVYGPPEQNATEEPKAVQPVDNSCKEPEEASISDKMCTCRRCTLLRGGSPVEYIERNSCCSRCGQFRGTNEDCILCRFVNKMENGCRPKPIKEEEECDCDDCVEDDDICNSDVFELNLEGKPIYEGGMCMNRARHFLWKNSEGPSFRDLAFKGTVYTGYGAPPGESANEEEMECTCEEHMKMMEKNKYKGGMEIKETLNYLWSRPLPK